MSETQANYNSGAVGAPLVDFFFNNYCQVMTNNNPTKSKRRDVKEEGRCLLVCSSLATTGGWGALRSEQ